MNKFFWGLCCVLTFSGAAFAGELSVRPGIYHSADYPECNFNVETRGTNLFVIANVAPSSDDTRCRFGVVGYGLSYLTNATLTFQCNSQDFSSCTTQKVVTDYCPGCTNSESWYQLSTHLMDDGRLTFTETYQSYGMKVPSNLNAILYFAMDALEPFVFQKKSRSADPDLSLNTNCDLAKADATKEALEKCHQFYYSCTISKVELKRSTEGVSCSATAFISGTN